MELRCGNRFHYPCEDTCGEEQHQEDIESEQRDQDDVGQVYFADNKSSKNVLLSHPS